MTSILNRIYKSTLGIYERKDLSGWERRASMPGCSPRRRIYGMYHVFCDVNWGGIVRGQLDRLCRSGLLEASDALYVSCIAKDEDDVRRLRQMLSEYGKDKIRIVCRTSDPARYEYPALDYMYEKSQKEDFLFYYFHTKGISYQAVSEEEDAVYRGFVRKITAWRRMMEYFLMDRWQAAVGVLNSGYDTYGCYLFPPFDSHMYAGNFWWTTSGYFRTLDRLDESTKLTNRFMAEEWLLSKNTVKAFSAFDTVADLYFVEMPVSLYESGKRNMWQALRFCVVYTLRKYQRKWFGYSYKKRCQERYQKLKRTL